MNHTLLPVFTDSDSNHIYIGSGNITFATQAAMGMPSVRHSVMFGSIKAVKA